MCEVGVVRGRLVRFVVRFGGSVGLVDMSVYQDRSISMDSSGWWIWQA